MSETVQPSLLEQLRQRVQQDFAPAPISPNERLAAFGRGVLSNRGSFLDNLSAGLAGQQQAEATRREEGRKAIETQGTLAYRDAEIELNQAKFRYDQDPTNPVNILRLAQAQQALSANRPQYQVVGTDANGNAVVVDMRDPSRTRTLEGVRPTRSEIAEGAATRARIEAANRAAQTALENARRAGQVSERDPAGQTRFYQEAFQRALQAMENAAAASSRQGPQSPAAPTEGASGQTVRLPGL